MKVYTSESNTKLTRFVRIWNDYDNALCSSVTRNSIVKFKVDKSTGSLGCRIGTMINGLCWHTSILKNP